MSKTKSKIKSTTPAKHKAFEGIYNQQIAIPPSLNTSDFLKSYGEIGWLFACVSKIMQNIADSEWNAYKKADIVSSKAMDLFMKPNPFQSNYEILQRTSMFLELRGKAFWYLAKDGVNRPKEIWVISPLDMWVIPDKNNFIKGYIYRAGTQQIPLNIDEVIMFNYPDPLNPYGGISPSQAAANSLETDKYSAQWNRNFFYNSAEPQGVISSPNGLTDDQFERLQEQWNDKYKGVDNAKRTALLEGGATYTAIQISQKDMDFFNLRQMNRDEILGAFGIHKSILGLTDDVSRANAETAEYTFQKHVIKPKLRFIQEKLNNEYIPMFNEDIVLKYTDPVPENKEFIRDTADKALDKSITKNEHRQILNRLLGTEFAPIKGGDEIYQPVSNQPLGTSLATATVAPVSINNNFDKTSFGDVNESLMKDVTSTAIKMKIAKIVDKNNDTRHANFIKMANPLISEFKAIITSYFKDMQQDIVKKVLEGSRDPVDLKKWNKTLQDNSIGMYVKCFKTGGDALVSEFKNISYSIKSDIGVSFNIKDPRVQEKIKTKLNNSTQINKDTKKRIRDAIEEMYNSEDGFTIKDIAEKLGSTDFAEFDEARCQVIAQTETLGSLNQATLEGYHQNSDLIDGKYWLATYSSGSRQSHIDAADEYSIESPIPVDDDFIVAGYGCQCPMDNGLPAEEAVNCHCCMAPYIKV